MARKKKADDTEAKSAGRPTFDPTERDRRVVEAMASYGEKQDNIARIIGIDAKTLRKHFRDELDLAAIKANAQVCEAHFHKCVGRPAIYDKDGRMVRREVPAETAAIIWWQKTRMGWHEKIELDHTGDGMRTDIRLTLAALKPDERDTLRQLLEAAAERRKQIEGTAVEG